MVDPLQIIKMWLRRLRLRLAGVRPELRCDLLPLGRGTGTWFVCPDRIRPDSVVYSFGVGDNIDWDLAMIERFGVRIHAFDPTPRAGKWIAGLDLPERFIFHDVGLAAHDGTMTFHPPRKDGDFNYSLLKRRGPKQSVEGRVRRLSGLMEELGHDRVDVLKMDIEGAEDAALPDILEAGVPMGQLLVELHYNFKGISFGGTLRLIDRLRAAGMRLAHVSGRGYEFTFVNERAFENPPRAGFR